MADIFISYKREDQEEHGRVAPIAEALRAEGYEVFYDVQVPPGSTWEHVLQSKIDNARAVLVLWSQASVTSDWVKEEAEMAKHGGKLIPVFLDAVPAPFGFGRIEGANLVDWTGDLDNLEWKNLVAAVKSMIGGGERAADPAVTRVDYRPTRKSVTVSKTQPKTGGAMKWIGALVALALIGGLGVVGYGLVQQNDMLRDRETDAAIEDAVTPGLDERAWAEAKATDTIEGYRAYLDLRVQGAYRAEALARIEALEADAETEPTRPAITGVVGGGLQARRIDPPNVELSPAMREAVLNRGAITANLGESCRAFENRNFTLRNEGREWRLLGDGRLMPIRFPNEAEGEQALAILETMRVNQYCTVGAGLSYWKNENGLPTGALRGEDCLNVVTDEIGYKYVGGRHTVASANSSLFVMPTEAEARKAITIMSGLGANRVCYLGRPGPSLTYLKR